VSARSGLSARLSSHLSSRSGLSSRSHGPLSNRAGVQELQDLCRDEELDTAGRLRGVEALIEAGLDVNQRFKVHWQQFRTTALFEASINGEHLLARLLLDYSADPHVRLGPPEFTCLYNAALNGHTRVVDMLVERGASPAALTVDGLSPLYAAAQEGHLGCVHALLRSRLMTKQVADLKLPPKLGGHTALHAAAQGGHSHVVRALLAYGASADPPTTDDGSTPLMITLFVGARVGGTAHLRCAQALLRGGASLQAVDASGRNALAWVPSEWHAMLREYARGGGSDDHLVARVVKLREQRERLGSPSRSAGALQSFMGGLVAAFAKCCSCCVAGGPK
jgi:ankyrin repeat protein